jgi:hypothetical protein
MKYLLLVTALITGIQCYGQKITGVVIDKSTRRPISGAVVSLGGSKTSTNFQGLFEIEPTGLNDSLKLAHFGYKTYSFLPGKAITTVHIELEPVVIALKEVTIHSNRDADFKRDSIENRVAYAKQFNYKGPTVMDAFTGNPNKGPGELVSINPLILIAAFTKKSTPEYKFNKILLRDEEAEYVDRKFNRGIVSSITGLKGDTLSAFLVNYRPTYQFAKKATDYDMEVYIKDCLKKLEKDGVGGSDPFVK